ncbi:hypothetical protein ACFFMH_01375 [Rufibacter immobilis]
MASGGQSSEFKGAVLSGISAVSSLRQENGGKTQRLPCLRINHSAHYATKTPTLPVRISAQAEDK